MKVAGFISAAIGLAVAVGAGLSLLIAPSAIALCLLLLGLVLFFIAAAAAQRRDLAVVTQPLAKPSTTPARREPDSVKLRRSAAKLGVEMPPETAKPSALNEDAAKDALREILGKRATR